MKNIGALAFIPTATLLSACVIPQSESQFDQEALGRYRAALPQQNALSATEVPDTSTKGTPAIFPTGARAPVKAVNGSVKTMIESLEAIVEVEPTLYNSQSKEFFWGPYDNDEGFGTFAAYIRENDEGDFKFSYALLRGEDQDVSKLRPVIWGGANPDADHDDFGSGVTLWDFEANAAFLEEFDPAYDVSEQSQGRFIALYGRGPAEDNPDDTLALVFAVFRDFVPQDNPAATPADADYLYGRYTDSSESLDVDFLDLHFPHDIDDEPSSLEDAQVRLAFVNQGIGRAEVALSGGDLGGDTITAIECWDASVETSYLSLDGSNDAHDSEFGDFASGCAAPFSASLDALGVPDVQSVPSDIYTVLNSLAENGMPADAQTDSVPGE